MPATVLTAHYGDGRRVYRLVDLRRHEDNDLNQWTSNFELGKKPRPPERTNPLTYYGVSMWATEEAARKANRRRKPPLDGIAIVVLCGERGIWWARTLGRSAHRTVWGRPEALAASVKDVVSV